MTVPLERYSQVSKAKLTNQNVNLAFNDNKQTKLSHPKLQSTNGLIYPR